MALKGSCLCGSVRYEIDQLDTPIGHCHCTTCRKAHAASFASTARVNREHFRLLSGHDKLSAFESSPGRFRRFCPRCGSHILAERLEDPHVVLRVATLDDDPGVRPVVHIFIADAVPWLDEGDDLPRYLERPPRR
jgi:hypothetical protein